ncbi:hypothetical protein SS50377_20899 [Spironucleus salmonicida]|uniref:B box-type domain-containing protein n=1 Tax=Spironucleus salmonicida TaxID=348837 RepID=V6LS17_9EUKA|nr:hypothetical protein SS50377_20899 [Spironucleus salmonicida]|eukprot:EST43574.1 hypothetical protein SS50377_16614 [Spironucleus salmonicida]
MPEEKSKSKSRSKSSSKDKVSSKQHTSSSKTKLVEDSIISQNPPTLLKSVEDPCENCQQESSINFCPTCDLKLCIQCTNKIHSQIPAFSLHKILPAQSASLHRVQCNIHKNRAILYCETCQEFICPQCQESLHQGIQHQTITIQQAFNVKLNSIRSRISTEISPLKMKLNNVHEKYREVIKRLNDKVTEITLFTRNECESIIQRLNRAGAQKTSKIQPDFNYLAENLNNIEKLEQMMIMMYQESYNQLNLFQQVPEMLKMIDQIVATDIVQLGAGVQAIDFELPQEMKMRSELVQESAGSNGILKAKECIIQRLQNELNQLVLASKKEILSWENLVGQYCGELKEASLQCCFCGAKCGYLTVNSVCANNWNVEKGSIASVERAEKILEEDCEIEVEEALLSIGNDRHYFVRSFK